MTAISLGRFLRGVAIPSDFGSIFTTAVDMPRIMTQSEPRPHSEIGANFRGLSPGASPRLSAPSAFSGVDFPRSPLRSSLRVSAPPRQIRGFVGSTPARLASASSVLQLETQRDVRLVKLGNRTSRLGVLHRLLERLFAGAGHLGLQLQMAFRNRETVGQFLEGNRARRLQTLRGQPREPKLRGKRHGKAPGVRGSQQLFRIGALPIFKSRPKRVWCAGKDSAGGGDLSLPGLQIAAPLSVSCTFHDISMQHGYPGKQENCIVANRRIEEQLESLGRLRGVPAAEAAPALRKALAGRVNLVAAKAANLAADLNVPDVLPDLLRAFDRLFEDPVKRDPQCWGKNAMARALKDLGHRESSAFVRGAVHIQMEPVWGGQEDTAGPLRGICLLALRGICLLALPACADLAREQVLRHMVNALTEPSPTVRADAARALAEMQGDDCALLLRLKARSGDAEPAVTGQVLESLIALERRDALPFVRQFLAAADQVAEEAALALGGSRQSDAVDVLLEAWPTARGLEYRQALLRALSISRQDRAIEFLNHLAAEGRAQDAADARAALELLPTAVPPPLETE